MYVYIYNIIYIISHEIPSKIPFKSLLPMIHSPKSPIISPPLKRWGQHFQWPHHRLLRLEEIAAWEWPRKPMAFPIGSAVFTVSLGGNSGRKMGKLRSKNADFRISPTNMCLPGKWGSTDPIVVKYSNGNANRRPTG